ncbi:MAG: type I-C CRISPR-associated endonuclease Cas1c [Gammaproteobacteria bacterium]|nr:type I-C CRISPR-associated endonuclease Cas1c [Gammaproteobacteria bacterium]MBU1656453.1 type I-C CRISPR-associated endonuclease Cas1c [Gammaproteobacteria bacterium]MBU1962250.1 type I-C CRISPR-associated endonuclease Cas1c [Gammaproteobacteria bacterium]
MKKLLNTLYVTSQGAYLAKEGETVLVRVEQETRLRLPIHTLGAIVCFGQVSASPALMGMCGERDVALSFLTENGRFLARVQGPVSGNVLLRREQYRWADDPDRCARIARLIVAAKVANSRTVLQRALRDHPENDGGASLTGASSHLAHLLQELRRENTALDSIRGWEGEAARGYFGVFDHLITTEKEAFFFRGRSRRPPLDNMNALLSFIYTLIAHDVAAALEGVGLDPAVGYLHRDRPGRPGLALDLMEELRAYLGDRLALGLVNRRQVKAKGFRTTESGAVSMDDDTRKTLLIAYQERKREEITHPFLGEKIEIGLLPHVQAMLMARHLRGDLEAYPPFVWR